jgi:hypothetical protein
MERKKAERKVVIVLDSVVEATKMGLGVDRAADRFDNPERQILRNLRNAIYAVVGDPDAHKRTAKTLAELPEWTPESQARSDAEWRARMAAE